jgi:uncharacterized protein with HEPN domain
MWRDEANLLDMLIASRKLQKYLDGIDLDSFLESESLQLITSRLIEILGEAANRVSDSTQHRYPEIPWRSMVSLRNRVIHEYDRINYPVIFKIVREEIPNLIKSLERTVPDRE